MRRCPTCGRFCRWDAYRAIWWCDWCQRRPWLTMDETDPQYHVVACPRCGAGVGEPCHYPGGERRLSHVDRQDVVDGIKRERR